MSIIATLLVIAILIEAVVEYFNLIFVKKAIVWKQVAAIVLGVFLAFAANVDLFKALGITFVIPYVGIVLTGIIMSRGPNYVADFIKMIQSVITQASNGNIPDHILFGDADADPAEDDSATNATDALDAPAAAGDQQVVTGGDGNAQG